MPILLPDEYFEDCHAILEEMSSGGYYRRVQVEKGGAPWPSGVRQREKLDNLAGFGLVKMIGERTSYEADLPVKQIEFELAQAGVLLLSRKQVIAELRALFGQP